MEDCPPWRRLPLSLPRIGAFMRIYGLLIPVTALAVVAISFVLTYVAPRQALARTTNVLVDCPSPPCPEPEANLPYCFRRNCFKDPQEPVEP